ncbi:hypothetical protein GCM10010129_15240 [Streptomyces fumigatiscleroticus]|nr:hypothetical protein GCM10010129_15240 [Streptomyces fumigatiscleroticus]
MDVVALFTEALVGVQHFERFRRVAGDDEDFCCHAGNVPPPRGDAKGLCRFPLGVPVQNVKVRPVVLYTYGS